MHHFNLVRTREKEEENRQILEKIVPLELREKYLSGKDYVFIEQLCQSLLRAPGETRIEKKVLERGISEGVRMGFFGDWDFRE